MARLLFVHPRRATFILLDRELLAERHELEDLYQPGRFANPLAVLAKVRRNDAVVAWWASWHSFWPITLAWLLRRPSVLIVGGFDTASEPAIGYGYQAGGLRKHLARWIMRRAGVLATNSEYSRGEIERNCEISGERVTVVHHGVPDPFAELDRAAPRERVALTVGVVDRANLERKGLRPFVETAAQLPDVRFVVIGRDARRRGGAARAGGLERRAARLRLRRRAARAPTARRRSTSRPPSTRASASPSRRRCWPAACPSSRPPARCPRSSATRGSSRSRPGSPTRCGARWRPGPRARAARASGC